MAAGDGSSNFYGTIKIQQYLASSTFARSNIAATSANYPFASQSIIKQKLAGIEIAKIEILCGAVLPHTTVIPHATLRHNGS